MNKKTILIITILVLLLGTITFYYHRSNSENVTYEPIPSIEPSEEWIEYAKSLKEYDSVLGFSFLYPPHLYVMEDPEPFIPERLFVLPVSIKKGNTDDIHGIIISTAENDEEMTPLEWLKGSNSGADLSKGYNILNIDSQEAVSLNGGTWVVVNTLDNKYRISIALLPSKNGDLLFTEIGIIINSLRFSK